MIVFFILKGDLVHQQQSNKYRLVKHLRHLLYVLLHRVLLRHHRHVLHRQPLLVMKIRFEGKLNFFFLISIYISIFLLDRINRRRMD